MLLTDRVVNLFDEHVDVALRIGELPDSSLLATRVGAIRRVVCASPAYLAARGMPMSPPDLVAHDCIAFEGLTSPQTWNFRSGNLEQPVRVHSRLRVNPPEAAGAPAIGDPALTSGHAT